MLYRLSYPGYRLLVLPIRVADWRATRLVFPLPDFHSLARLPRNSYGAWCTFIYFWFYTYLKNSGKLTFTFGIYVLSFNSVYRRQASDLHNALPRELVTHTHNIDINNYTDIPTGRKTSVDQGKDGETNTHENGKSLRVLCSTYASNISCTIHENTIPTAGLYGCETFPLACSGWRGQMIWSNRRR